MTVSNRLLLPLLWFLLPSFTLAQPGTCAQVEPFSLQFLDVLAGNCLTDRSSCSDGTRCECNDGDGSGQLALAACTDGCNYFYGTQPIRRVATAGSVRVGNVGGGSVPFYSTTIGFRHLFIPNTDEGAMEYYYTPNDQNIRAPAQGRTCSALLDGQNCACSQKFCDDAQETFANIIDCSPFDGGTIIDLCLPPPPISDQSTKMEILFWVPQLICDDPSLLSSDDNVTGNDDGNGSNNGGGQQQDTDPDTSNGMTLSFMGSLWPAILLFFL